MNESAPWLLYGANGYTGRRIAEEAVRRGLRPVLGGRDAGRVGQVASSLGCATRVFGLNDVAAIRRNIEGMAVVLNCAGPFSATARPMIAACLASGVHYLDITGEIDVIEQAAAQDAQAREAGVAVIPAVGFDVVPGDCLAAMLHARLPAAQRLLLAFAGTGGVSRGTARTMLESLPRGGRARIDGRIVRVPLAWKSREIPFRRGPRTAVTIPWGDVASAYYSTGVPNIEVYLAMDRRRIAWLRRLRPVVGLLRLPWPRRLAEGLVRRFMAERPSERKRGQAPSPDSPVAGAALEVATEPVPFLGSFWGQAVDAQGHAVEATIETLGGYALTVETALACLGRVLAGRVAPGFAPPSQAFGPEFILSMPETDIQWGAGR